MRRRVDRLVAQGLTVALHLLLWFGFATSASAHTRSETHSAWQVDGGLVRVTYTVPDLEARRLTKDGSRPNDPQLLGYLMRRIGVNAVGGACPLAGSPQVVSSAPGYRAYEFDYVCASPRDLQLHSAAFFDIVPTHTNFAQIQMADGELIEQLITRDHQILPIGGGAENRLQNASFLDYVVMGVMHIFTGVDHQSFLVGLVLISRRLRDLTFVITGFTIGHSITLALAVTGIIRPHAEYIDALVALTIALIGAENAAIASRRPALIALGLGGLLVLMGVGKLVGFGGLPVLIVLGAAIFTVNYLFFSSQLSDAGRVRLVVTVVFGLIHGFGFASDLLEMKLPTGRLAELLVGFNIGVEIGQLTLVLSLLAVVALLSRLRLALPRRIVVDASSAFLVALGLYWFVSRSYVA